jgi:arsenate reductase (thioredoxin)
MPSADHVYDVLFLCTGNSARSIMAESILRNDGAGRFRVYSAGSNSRGPVNPLTLEVLESYGYPTDGLRSKSWDEFAAPGAPDMDFIFTVCDDAAGEACPIWPGHPVTALWAIENPAKATGTELEIERAFVAAFRYLKNRIALFIALPLATIDKLALSQHLEEIGRLEGDARPHAGIASCGHLKKVRGAN